MNDVTIKETHKKEYEVMVNNTYIHPDEKKLIREHVTLMMSYADEDDVDTLENKIFKKTMEVLNRISL